MCVLLAVVGMQMPTAMMAQETRGSLMGRVLDPSGAVIAGATVQATNVATNVSESTKSNSEGLYVVPYLRPGTYRLTVEAAGFKTFERSGIVIRIAETIQIQVPMELGNAAEKITVTAETPLIESSTATVGNIADQRRVSQLPVAHGQPYAMMALSPGLVYAQDPRYDRPYETNYIAYYTMDGVPSGRSEITLDGSNNTTLMNLWHVGNIMAAYSPPADMVQELKVQTVTYDASVGHTQGGLTAITLKSGGNRPHGTAYWSGKNPALNANMFFANAANQPRPDFYYNRWGGSFTGPVYIPKVFDGRDKIFISYGYEGIHEARPRGSVITTPTVAERQGDFSALLNIGSNYQIYDPSTRVALPNGRYSVQPFSGNVIPPSSISRIATNMLTYWPMPNIAGTSNGSSNLDRTNEPEKAEYWNHIFRADFNVNSKDKFFVRGNTYHRTSHDSNVFHSAAGGCCHGYWTQRAMAVDNVYSITPTTLLDTRVAFTRHPLAVDAPEEEVGFDLASLGFPASFADAAPQNLRRFPQVSIAGYMAPSNASYWFPHQNWNAEGILMLVRGKHTIKTGGDFRSYRTFGFWPGNTTSGSFTFGTAWTQGPLDNSAASPIGQGLAAMLLGLPTAGLVDRNASYVQQNTVYSVFFHDDWHITPRLTLNLGVRYELEGPMTERYNRSVTGFDFNTPSPLNNQVKANYAQNPIPEIPASQFQVLGGLLFAGVGGQSSALWNPDTNNVMPRIGFVYQLRPKTVVRGGYGIFYGPLGVERVDVKQTGFSRSTVLVPSLDNGLTFIATLANPFPNGIDLPLGAASGLMTYAGKAISFYNQNPQAPRQQRWSMGVQHELPQRVLLDVSYVGNHGGQLEVTRDYQSLPLKYLSTSPTRDQANINNLTAQVPNPFYPLLPGTGLAGQTISRATLIQEGSTPYPQFTGMSSTEFTGYSWYHSLQVKGERRFAGGWTLMGAYTWSKYMEAMGHLNGYYSPLEYVVADQDRPQRLSISGIWALPFGKDRKFLTNSSRAVNAVVGGWQLEGIYTAQSGEPFGFPAGTAFFGDINNIALPPGQRTVDHWFNTNAGFEKNSAQQLAYNYRVLSTRFNNLRGRGWNLWDLSGMKTTAVTEGFKVELRWEMLNAFNHTDLALPDTNPTSQTFGRVLSQLGYARTIQFGLKLLF
jgi:hypothetical protein